MESPRRRLCVGTTVVLLALLLVGCAARQAATIPAQPAHAHEQLNSVLWAYTSAEYAAACSGLFMLAMLRLDEAVSDKGWTASLEQTGDYQDLPPAVIVDVDETVLDNSAFEARLIIELEEYNKPMWDAWIAEEAAPPVGGSQAFLELARRRGVEIFFVTNRDHDTEEQTVRNLRNHFGAAVSGEQVLTRGERPDWTTDKTSRRAYIAATHRILLLIGDNLNDFTHLGEISPRARLEKSSQYSDYWGRKWIVLPNAMYGSWEQALYGYDRDLERPEKLKMKQEYLEPSG